MLSYLWYILYQSWYILWHPARARDIPTRQAEQMYRLPEAGKVRAAGSIKEHGHNVALHDSIWSQCDGFKNAEEHQGEFLALPEMTKGASGENNPFQKPVENVVYSAK